MDAQTVRSLAEDVVLLSGGHKSADAGLCLMEAVAFVAGEDHTDSPACACPVIAAVGRRLNDRILDDDMRTALLKPLGLQLIGTRSTKAVEMKRALFAVDWAVRVNTPRWMGRVPGLEVHATALVALPTLDSEQACRDAMP